MTLFRWLHWEETHFVHTQTPVFIHTVQGSLQVSDAKKWVAACWQRRNVPQTISLPSPSRRRNSPRASHISDYGINHPLLCNIIMNEINGVFTSVCTQIPQRRLWKSFEIYGALSGCPCVWLCAACHEEMAAVCPQWECCVSGAATPALIKLAPTRLCLGFRAQLLYSMATGIQTHVTHKHMRLCKMPESLTERILVFITMKAMNVAAWRQTKPCRDGAVMHCPTVIQSLLLG